jgi:hypothetical protein
MLWPGDIISLAYNFWLMLISCTTTGLFIVHDWYAAVVSGSTGTMDQEQKREAPCGIYTYKHHCSMGVDVHEVFVKKSRLRIVLSYIGIVFLLVNVSQPLLAKV